MKTLIDDQRIGDLIEQLKEMKDKGALNADYDKIAALAEEIYDSYNPLDNDVDLGDTKIKWKVKPDWNNLKEKTKFEFEVEKDLKDDDVQLILKVNGKTSIFDSKPGNNDFKAQIGFNIKY